jgi:hypothetical protein
MTEPAMKIRLAGRMERLGPSPRSRSSRERALEADSRTIILGLSQAFRRRDGTLADADTGIPGVATVTHRIVQLDDVDVVAGWRCS